MATMTGRLYALASGLGMVERNNKEDAFHQLVYGLTGKEHVSDLTTTEAKAVQKELQDRMRLGNRKSPLKRNKKRDVPGMMTTEQQKKAWQLVYRLNDIDPKDVPVVDRLIGAIEKVLGITASKADPFRWVNFDDGTKLIEQLKRYVRSAERKAAKRGGG